MKYALSLFKPLRIKNITLKNRICMPAMHLNYTPMGFVSEKIVEFYRKRAKGGASLIVVGGASVDRAGSNPLMLGAHRDEFIEGLSRLASAIKEEGAVAGIQLYHSGRYNYSFITGEQPIAPSAVPSRFGDQPKEMSREDIKRVQKDFVSAAVRAKKAGFDLIEISGSAGYLVCQFLSPLVNKRTDEYGGSLENRFRFVGEIIEMIKEKLGDAFPISIRVAGDDFVPGSNSIDEVVEICKLYESKGVDLLSVTGGWHETRIPQITMQVPEATFFYLAREIKREVGIPVAASNRIRKKETAERLIDEFCADLINLGRPLISDPYLPQKWENGQDDNVLYCIGCNQGCFDPLLEGKPSTCTLNPEAGREYEKLFNGYKRKKKRLLIVGGGPGGISSALTSKKLGYDVTLVEESNETGGMLKFAYLQPGKDDWIDYLNYSKRKLKEEKVEVILEKRADKDFVKQYDPDALIVATGAELVVPEIPGIDDPRCVLATDVMMGKVKAGRRVVIIGGGGVGVETALFLSEKGTLNPEQFYFLWFWSALNGERARRIATRGTMDITVLKRSPGIGRGLPRSTRWVVVSEIRKRGVKVYQGVEFKEITADGVVCNIGGKEKIFPADTIVIATGLKPRRELYEQLKEEVNNIKLIGDAKEPRRAIYAIHEGFEAVVNL